MTKFGQTEKCIDQKETIFLEGERIRACNSIRNGVEKGPESTVTRKITAGDQGVHTFTIHLGSP